MILEVPRCSKICALSGREITPGATVFSALVEDGENYRRIDYSAEGWKTVPKPNTQFLGWWKTRIPLPHENKAKIAPNDILFKLFEQSAEQLEKQEMRYMLALLLVRRRVFRIEREEDADGQKILGLYCPKQDSHYEIIVATPSRERIEEVQNELAALLS